MNFGICTLFRQQCLGHCFIAILMVFFNYFIQPLREIFSSARFGEWGVRSEEWGRWGYWGEFLWVIFSQKESKIIRLLPMVLIRIIRIFTLEYAKYFH
jgi:hypothetical protein